MVWWCVWCPPPQGLEALAPPLKRREAAALLQAAPFLLEGGLLSQVRAHPRDGWGGGGAAWRSLCNVVPGAAALLCSSPSWLGGPWLCWVGRPPAAAAVQLAQACHGYCSHPLPAPSHTTTAPGYLSECAAAAGACWWGSQVLQELAGLFPEEAPAVMLRRHVHVGASTVLGPYQEAARQLVAAGAAAGQGPST